MAEGGTVEGRMAEEPAMAAIMQAITEDILAGGMAAVMHCLASAIGLGIIHLITTRQWRSRLYRRRCMWSKATNWQRLNPPIGIIAPVLAATIPM
jgi:hypothetical protein